MPVLHADQYKGPEVTSVCGSWWGDLGLVARAQALGTGSPFLPGWPGGRVTGPRPVGPHSPQLRSLTELSGETPRPQPRPSGLESQVSSWRLGDTGLGRESGGRSRKTIRAVGSRHLPARSSQAWAAGGAVAGPSPKHFRRAPAFQAASAGRAGLGRGDPARFRVPGSFTRPRSARGPGAPRLPRGRAACSSGPGRCRAWAGEPASEAGRRERVCGG